MGQPVTVVESRSNSNPAILRFDTNRPLSGMGHDRYESPPGELRKRTVDELARRLFAAGGVEKVHINGSVVTVTLTGGQTGAGLGDVIRELFLHYGVQPQTAEAEAPRAEADNAPESLADTSDAPAAREAAGSAPDPVDSETTPAADQSIEGIPDDELVESDEESSDADAGEGPAGAGDQPAPSSEG